MLLVWCVIGVGDDNNMVVRASSYLLRTHRLGGVSDAVKFTSLSHFSMSRSCPVPGYQPLPFGLRLCESFFILLVRFHLHGVNRLGCLGLFTPHQAPDFYIYPSFLTPSRASCTARVKDVSILHASTLALPSHELKRRYYPHYRAIRACHKLAQRPRAAPSLMRPVRV